MIASATAEDRRYCANLTYPNADGHIREMVYKYEEPFLNWASEADWLGVMKSTIMYAHPPTLKLLCVLETPQLAVGCAGCSGCTAATGQARRR